MGLGHADAKSCVVKAGSHPGAKLTIPFSVGPSCVRCERVSGLLCHRIWRLSRLTWRRKERASAKAAATAEAGNAVGEVNGPLYAQPRAPPGR